MIMRGFIRAEDAVYVGLGTVLAAMALACSVRWRSSLARTLLPTRCQAMPCSCSTAAPDPDDRRDPLHREVSFSEHALVPEPFLDRRPDRHDPSSPRTHRRVRATVESNTAVFRAAMLELGLLTVMIVALVVSLVRPEKT